MSEPKSDEDYIKEIKSYLPKDPNAITDWWEFDRKTKATLAAVREEERENIFRRLKGHYWDSLEPERNIIIAHISAALTPTQDDTNLST